MMEYNIIRNVISKVKLTDLFSKGFYFIIINEINDII